MVPDTTSRQDIAGAVRYAMEKKRENENLQARFEARENERGGWNIWDTEEGRWSSRQYALDEGEREIMAGLDIADNDQMPEFNVPEGFMRLRKTRDTIDVVAVDFDENKRGNGAFTRYLDLIEEYANQRGSDVRACEITNTRLERFLKQRGYEFRQDDQTLPVVPTLRRRAVETTDERLREFADKHAERLNRRFASERAELLGGRNFGYDVTKENLRQAVADMERAAKPPQRPPLRGGRGAKPANDCLHVSLSWAESERPTNEHMRETAHSAMKELKMENQEYLMVRHRDFRNGPHPHMHIIAQRRGPDGLIISDWKNARTLQNWADEYERQHGRVRPPRDLTRDLQREANRERMIERTPEMIAVEAEQKKTRQLATRMRAWDQDITRKRAERDNRIITANNIQDTPLNIRRDIERERPEQVIENNRDAAIGRYDERGSPNKVIDNNRNIPTGLASESPNREDRDDIPRELQRNIEHESMSIDGPMLPGAWRINKFFDDREEMTDEQKRETGREITLERQEDNQQTRQQVQHEAAENLKRQAGRGQIRNLASEVTGGMDDDERKNEMVGNRYVLMAAQERDWRLSEDEAKRHAQRIADAGQPQEHERDRGNERGR